MNNQAIMGFKSKETLLDSYATFEDYLNQSCSPNCFIQFDPLVLVAKRNIQKGEELTFNYNATEYGGEGNHSFQCTCGSEGCYGEIKGFKYINQREREQIKEDIFPDLKKIMAKVDKNG
ncbi:MAG: SET domain-containing protein-lysine N-methyltransferase [Nanoarchaeota archaeon]|nr:SET domain-containing protein-lysine N-methyltransferase [Nanoarchaeota archaeon]